MPKKNNNHVVLGFGPPQDKKPQTKPAKPKRIRPKRTGVLSSERFLVYWKERGVE